MATNAAAMPLRTEFPLTTDPFKYRLMELVGVYGDALRERSNELWGDGILSAIDCKVTLEKKGELDNTFILFLGDNGTGKSHLAQAIGRIACIITGDAMGKPTNGPFGVAYTNPGAMVPELGVYYTPTPVYEIIMNLAIFAVVWRLRNRKLPEGGLFLIYLLLYSTGRFIVTFWSSYRIVALGLNQAQLVSLAALIIGLPWLVYLLRGHKAVRATV